MSGCPKNYTWSCQQCSNLCKDYHISKSAVAQSAEIQFTTALGLLGEIMSYDYWEKFPENIRERAEAFLDQFDKTGTDPLFEAYRAAQRQAGREEMSSAEYVLRLISEPDPWYRDMNPKKQVELIRDRARKALDDLVEAKGVATCLTNR